MRGKVAKRLRKVCKERAKEYGLDWEMVYNKTKKIRKLKKRLGEQTAYYKKHDAAHPAVPI